MENLFSLTEVVEFTAQNNLGLWTRQIYDYKLNKIRPAKLEDFEEDKTVTMELLVEDERILKDFVISNFQFVSKVFSPKHNASIVEKDLTEKWKNLISKIHNEVYSNILTKPTNTKTETFKVETNTTKNKETKKAKKTSFLARILKNKKNKKEDENTLSN